MTTSNIIAQISIDKSELDIPTTDPITGGTVDQALTLVFGIAGAVAFLIIIYAGIQYILSRGEPEKTKKARDTIIYAAVGLGIAVLAFSIVTFVTKVVS